MNNLTVVNKVSNCGPAVKEPVLRERLEKVYHTLEEALQNVRRIDGMLFIPKPCENENQLERDPVLTIIENTISLIEECAGKLEYETREINERI